MSKRLKLTLLLIGLGALVSASIGIWRSAKTRHDKARRVRMRTEPVRGYATPEQTSSIPIRYRSTTGFGGGYDYTIKSDAVTVVISDPDPSAKPRTKTGGPHTLNPAEQELFRDLVNIVVRDNLWEQTDVLKPDEQRYPDEGYTTYSISDVTRTRSFKIEQWLTAELEQFGWKITLLSSSIRERVK